MRRATIYMGSKCNLNCKYCHREYNGKEIQTEAGSKRLIEKLANFKPDEIKFMGGEPLLYFDKIVEIVNCFSDAEFIISTNGVLLDRYKEFIKQHKITVVLSYDGTDTAMRGYDALSKPLDYGLLGISCTLYHGNTDLRRIYANFAKKEQITGCRLPFYPHIMHVTNQTNKAFALTKEDYDSLIAQQKDIMGEFLDFYRSTGNPLHKYLPLFMHLTRAYKRGYEWGETYCINQDRMKLDLNGNEYTCLYMRDDLLEDESHKACLETMFPNCKTCSVYSMCGAACIKSKEHELECYYYKQLYSWFSEWYEANAGMLTRITDGERQQDVDLYVLCSASQEQGAVQKLAIDGNRICLTYNGQVFEMDKTKIPLGESAMLMYVDGEYKTVYYFKRFLGDAYTPKEFCIEKGARYIMQVNRMTRDRLFVKCYSKLIGAGEFQLIKDGKEIPYTFARYSDEYVQYLDRRHTFYLCPCAADIHDGFITTKWEIAISQDYPKPLYCNYNGHAKQVTEGVIELSFPYKECESFYWGDKDTKYKGRKYSLGGAT